MDPHPGRVKLPSSLMNKYSYTHNNPVNGLDPDGEFGILIGLLIGASISAGIALLSPGGNLDKALNAFGQTLLIGVAAVAGAFLATSIAAVAAGATVASLIGTGIGIAAGAIGGAIGSGVVGYRGAGLALAVLGGAFVGRFAGTFGYSLAPSGTKADVASGINDANRGMFPSGTSPSSTSGNYVPPNTPYEWTPIYDPGSSSGWTNGMNCASGGCNTTIQPVSPRLYIVYKFKFSQIKSLRGFFIYFF